MVQQDVTTEMRKEIIFRHFRNQILLDRIAEMLYLVSLIVVQCSQERFSLLVPSGLVFRLVDEERLEQDPIRLLSHVQLLGEFWWTGTESS